MEETTEERSFTFKPNYYAIGGIIIGGAVLWQLFGKSNPKFDDTTVPDGQVNQDRVQAMASELFELLDNSMLEFFDRRRCDALGRFGQFSNAEMVSVANYYKNKFGKTIRQSLADLSFRPCAFWQTDEEAHVLIRFAELQIP